MPSTCDVPDVSSLTLEEHGKEEGESKEDVPYCDRVVEKSKSDTCNYRSLTLKNGLKVLLVSDMETVTSDNPVFNTMEKEKTSTQKAAACLAVKVGSCQDPKNVLGLAHFLEHMLFMGSSKYPSENAYDDYLDHHGGESNASTDLEMTNFVFDVNVEHLEGALDRFASFFIAPLIRKGAMSREVRAVDSEYSMALQKDQERLDQIKHTLMQSDHPLNTFTAGNQESLSSMPRRAQVDTNQALKEFYEKYYSAHLMVLVVQSAETLDTLEDMVQVFEKIPNNGVEQPTLANHPRPVFEKNFIKYCPIKDKHKLHMEWYMLSQREHYRNKSDNYISWCVGHEGPGSILSKLKKDGLATSLSAGIGQGGDEDCSNFSKFSVEIQLSDEGLDQYKRVVEMVFQYINMLRREGPQEWIFREIQQMDQIDFDWEDPQDPYDNVEDLADNMLLYPEEHYITGPMLSFEYTPERITELLAYLIPDNVIITLQSKKLQAECKTVERWFKGRYNASKISDELLAQWRALGEGDFALPGPNKFIPENFDMKEWDTDGPKAAPVLLVEDSLHKVWYHMDDVFDMPEAYVTAKIFSKVTMESARSIATSDLFLACLDSYLGEKLYIANQAGLSWGLESSAEGWVLTASGYNDKLIDYFTTLVDELVHSVITHNFTMVKENLSRAYDTALIKPVNKAKELRLRMFTSGLFTYEDKKAELPNITAKDVEEFRSKLGNVFIEFLIGGNVTSAEATVYTDKLTNSICTQSGLPACQFYQKRVWEVPVGSWRLISKNENPEDVNTVVINYYQLAKISHRDWMLLSVLQSFMSEPLFDQLRTKLQLGYTVYSSEHNTHGMTGFSFTVCTQANKFTAAEVNIYIERFINWFKNYFDNIGELDFEEKVSGLINDRLHPQTSLSEEMEAMWTEIDEQVYIFDRDLRDVEVLKELSKGEVQSFIQKLFYKDVRKISVQVLGNPKGTYSSKVGSDSDSGSDSGSDSDYSDDEDRPRQANLRHLTPNDIKNYKEEITDVTSCEEFKKKCRLMPVYKMATAIITKDVTH